MKLLLLLLAPYLLIILCEPPTRIAALKFHNSTDTDLILFIENDPHYFGVDNYQEYPIQQGEIVTLYCFAFKKDAVDSYVDGLLFGRTLAPTFGLIQNEQTIKVWEKSSFNNSSNMHNPFNKNSWEFISENTPISCDGYTDTGSSIIFTINESVFNKN